MRNHTTNIDPSKGFTMPEFEKHYKPFLDDDDEDCFTQENPNPLSVQHGGNHYKKNTIQPIQYIFANKLGFVEGNIVKYITRWRDKGGIGDLEKIKHYCDLLINEENEMRI